MPAKRFDLIEYNPEQFASTGNGKTSIEQGATYTLKVTVYDEDIIKDLSGYSARMKIRKTPDSSTVIASYTSEFTISSNNDPNVTLSLTAAITAALDWNGPAFYDVEIDDGGGTPVVTRILEGYIELSKEVTY